MISGKVTAAVPGESLTGHSAVAAWSEFSGEPVDPTHIEVLRHGRKSATYRLVGAGPGGAPIIAQRSQIAKALIERTVYEQILPHVSVTSPRYYGFREESPEFAWLFLEDVGNERYSATDEAHLMLAGRWVGLMHTTAARVTAARGLPDGGPRRYLDHLRAGRHTIQANLANRALTATDVTTLRRIVSDLDGLEQRWAGVERACTGVPPTLVHGDFQRKNTYIRNGVSGPELFAIDWETAGWGVPAVDLTRIHLLTYWSVVQRCWPDVRLEEVRRLTAVGRVFLQLAAIHWVSPELAYDSDLYLKRPMSWLRVFHDRLADAALELGRLA
jgi:thiamine kinase-like enzyme